MLMIRFQRIGRKNDPAFRIAVLPKASGPKAGSYVDLVGTYNPKTKATTLKGDSIREWIAKGAQVSPSVHNLLIKNGVLEGKKINVLPKKTAPQKELTAEVVEEAPVAAAPAAAVPVAEAPEAPAPVEDAPPAIETTEEAASESASADAATPEAADVAIEAGSGTEAEETA